MVDPTIESTEPIQEIQAGNTAENKTAGKRTKEKKPKKEKKEKPAQGPGKNKQGGKKNEEGISVKKDENFAEWYQQVVTKAELIEYYDVSGCYILRPNSYNIWENIQNFFDGKQRICQSAWV